MSVKNALDSFAYDVIEGAKANLKRKDKNASKSLSNSLDYKLNVSKNSFSLQFFAEDYWEFVDKGVKGVGGKKADGTQWKKKRVTNSPFAYKSKRPPTKALNNWVVKRGLAPRNKKGQFTTRQGLLFAIANSVYHTGLETTNFFTKPFEKEFKSLPDELVEAYGLTVENLLNI